jgi:hypothetical protein
VIVMPMPQQYSRQYVVDLLNRLGLKDQADRASRDLPDPVDAHRLEAWCVQHGLTYDYLISRMGGSP